MQDTGKRMSGGTMVLLIVVVAVVTAVIAVVVQRLIAGEANTAITGGVVGAVIAVTAGTLRRRSLRG